MAVRAEYGIAHRIRRVQRSAARQHRGFDCRQSAIHQHLPRGPAGTGGRTGDCTRRAEQRRRCDGRGQSSVPKRLSAGVPSCAAASADPKTCLPPVALTAIPDGQLRAPYFLQWSFAIERQLGNTGSLRAQYVGTRAVNQPYSTQVNGYQTVCAGCFRPFPYDGLQLTAEKRIGHGLQVRANYTWSHCLDTVSNGGFLSFSALGIISPLPGMLGRQYGNCDYDIRHNVNANYVYELPVHARNSLLAKVVNGWQLSGTFFYHSGVPFTVQSAPYSANGNGLVQGGGPQFASVGKGVPLYRHDPSPGVTQPGALTTHL